jgi:SNF2 family DNA or RNA helicase
VTHEVYDESEDWHQLLETRSGKNRFQIQEPSAAEKRQKEEIERWFDNPAYQPMDFADACRLLDIDDPLYPRVHGQSFLVFLSPWQVTGIVQMVRFQMDETIRSCVLADATGLGKTFQILGHFLYVSTGSLRRAL